MKDVTRYRLPLLTETTVEQARAIEAAITCPVQTYVLASDYDALAADNARLRTRLADVERERDKAFATWKEFHQNTLAAFIKNEHAPLKTRLAETEATSLARYESLHAADRRLAEAERDAARYRRLLEGPYPFCFEGIMCHSAEDVSRAIDTAIREGRG